MNTALTSQARTDQIAEQMVRDMTPAAERALREALESRKFDDTILNLLHAMLWQPTAKETLERVDAFKSGLTYLAVLDYNVLNAARAQAEKEIDGGAL